MLLCGVPKESTGQDMAAAGRKSRQKKPQAEVKNPPLGQALRLGRESACLAKVLYAASLVGGRLREQKQPQGTAFNLFLQEAPFLVREGMHCCIFWLLTLFAPMLYAVI